MFVKTHHKIGEYNNFLLLSLKTYVNHQQRVPSTATNGNHQNYSHWINMSRPMAVNNSSKNSSLAKWPARNTLHLQCKLSLRSPGFQPQPTREVSTHTADNQTAREWQRANTNCANTILRPQHTREVSTHTAANKAAREWQRAKTICANTILRPRK